MDVCQTGALFGAFHNQGEIFFFFFVWKLKTEIHKRNEHIKTECGRPIRGLFFFFFVYLENAYFVFKCLTDDDCRRRSKRKMHTTFNMCETCSTLPSLSHCEMSKLHRFTYSRNFILLNKKRAVALQDHRLFFSLSLSSFAASNPSKSKSNISINKQSSYVSRLYFVLDAVRWCMKTEEILTNPSLKITAAAKR